jgi:hypothetical protein
LSQGFLENEKRRGEDEVLVRPVCGVSARWRSIMELQTTSQPNEREEEHRNKLIALSERLSIPRRPKWKRKPGTEAMTKKEVEKNEEGVFEKWRRDMESVMIDWEEVETEYTQTTSTLESIQDPIAGPSSQPITTQNVDQEERIGRNTHIPSFYESNLEVYRQLWRVIERSDIVLVLADVRVPGVHLGEAMRVFLREVVYGKDVGKRRDGSSGTSENGWGDGSIQGRRRKMGNKRVVVVLTKTDLVEDECRDGWVKWAKKWWKYGDVGSEQSSEASDVEEEEDIDVVCVENYERFQLAQGKLFPFSHIISILSSKHFYRTCSASSSTKTRSTHPTSIINIPDKCIRTSSFVVAIQRAKVDRAEDQEGC